eukprot:CAMPEP_0174867176 /NCGR_PEP_ID=MMETSP1114-20130205/63494_1 /TAXON_ID=312471 /ORGANISM="Neobodo designis, Strain CCAP 1951/1" /LENGTH=222 /DNA_ID=CAMNT_0016102353 /DNA_START=51 /DNA_END=715 /DNA_ORIENTATION=+
MSAYAAAATAAAWVLRVIVALRLHTLPRSMIEALADIPAMAAAFFDVFVLSAPAAARHTPSSPTARAPSAAGNKLTDAPKPPASNTTTPQRAAVGAFPDTPLPQRTDSEVSLLSMSDGGSTVLSESPAPSEYPIGGSKRDQYAPLLHSDDDGEDDQGGEADAEMDSDGPGRLRRRVASGFGSSRTVLPLTAEQVAFAAYVPPTPPTASWLPFCTPFRPAPLP